MRLAVNFLKMEVTIDSDLESVDLAEYGSERKRKQKPQEQKKNRKKSEI
jgi:cytochrome c